MSSTGRLSSHREELASSTTSGELQALVLEGLRPISTSLAIIFVVFGLFNFFDFPPRVRAVLVPHDIGLVVIFVALRFLVARARIPPRWANPVVAAAACLVLSNILLSLWLLRQPFYTVHVLLVLIGAAGFLLSTGWLAFTLAASSLAWALVAVRVTPLDLLVHYGFAMFVAVTLAFTIHTARLRAYRRLRGALDAARDEIRERKQAERALVESEERFRSISDQALMAIAIVQAGRIKYANRAFCTMSEYSLAEVLGWKEHEHAKTIHPDHLEYVMEQGRRKQAGDPDVEVHYAYRGVTRSGKVRWIDQWSTTINYGGDTADLITFIDIDDQRRAMEAKALLEEQLEQVKRVEALGRLAGGVAHDFNNLLMGLLGGVSLLELELRGRPDLHELLQEMRELAGRGADLTKQLLGFARRGKYDPKPLDLNRVVEKTLSVFGRTRKDLVLQLDLLPAALPVMGDWAQIEQVVLNLLLNAGQAMRDGGSLRLRTESVELEDAEVEPHGAKPGRYAKVSVIDTGIGMDAETRERIFEPFFTTKEIGHGLGLASAFGVVKNHGGFITVTSEPGKGSTFMVFLPATEARPSEERPRALEPRRGAETILVVDDEPQILKVCGRMLRTMGYEVLLAAGGEEALDLVRANQQRISLVLLDMLMPGMSGRQTFDALRALCPTVKILLSSGYSVEGQATEILEQGCDGFLQKPYTLETLSAKLRELLGGEAR